MSVGEFLSISVLVKVRATTSLSEFARKLALERWKKVPRVRKRCPTCGRDFEGVPQRKYCCNRCKALGWYREKKQRKKV
ncbi:hypothetical protein Q2T83_14860 [Fervidibacter sacchari]|uniref:Endogenous inhibitor of DNA gyrase (YacG/DUF329 family) n=1 Tax=Candidatus Fervidibacter sacchari TaxID=1448929 RepID=A0ABT2EIK8_9BACT|nr:hypothetical protein [Candidatus Fervidibacter sacchari]MCS3917778.1 endogenous inhibitor of DNA gyrase (YacG/DUF329 family) [Candidatus Fervidibacter sacchari]WKU15601.1 hypothetical protein Q2T83_14860 [Candidatus Fervidibacter sacchari]